MGVSSEKSKKYQSGWRQFQFQQYRDYVQPVLGKIRLNAITPQMVKRVLNRVAMMDRSPGTQRHVFVLMRKMFGDAIESYQYLTFNPAIGKFKPDIPFKEAKRLNLEQIKRLLVHVDGKKYGLAIWLQLYVGLRCGELQALRWEDIDLEDGRLQSAALTCERWRSSATIRRVENSIARRYHRSCTTGWPPRGRKASGSSFVPLRSIRNSCCLSGGTGRR